MPASLVSPRRPLRRAFRRPLACAAAVAWWCGGFLPPSRAADADAPRPADAVAVVDTEKTDLPLTAPEEALRSVQLPPGFRATLFAAEPLVRQPMGVALDPRGRLWVAENYTYAEEPLGFDERLRDRIVILDDADGDGRAEQRRVFWDEARKLTSVEVGLGGVWALCPPQLLFLPDRDGDDRPDGPPVVMLDGWDDDEVRHNVVNGLRWGPDGWLYGRHGILRTSWVGRPGAPRDERTPINCGIWRFHPERRVFEAVCHGGTNSWGMDWDAHGQPFFINTVIGHLWHVVPGAHYERMFGEDFNPRLYSLMPQTADHVHWDAGEEWRDIRDLGVTPGTDRAGGGHAHSGLMVYGGDNWPAAYRGNAFTLNFHGRRINRELLERRGAAYVGRHAPDVARFQDPWFRGLDLIYGQDGAVYVADWTDAGECHDSDGVHRNSGRIFKIMYGDAALRPAVDLAARSDLELIALLAHENDHFARQARTILQGRAAAGLPMDESRAALLRRFDEGTSVPCRLRALWCLQATGGLPSDWLQGLLADESEHLRAWAVRLLEENDALRGPALAELVRLAAREPSGLVQLTLASALQRLPLADRWPLALALARRDEFAEDPALPRMIWYGVEPAVPADPRRAVELASQSAMPLLQRHVARRLAEDLRSHPEPVADLGRRAAASESTALRREVLRGVAAALQGWRRVAPPAGWPDWLRQESASDDPERAALARELAVVFGDGRAAAELRAVAADARQPLEVRRAALESLVASRDAELPPLLRQLLADRDLVTDAARGLAAFDDPETARLLVEHYHLARSHARTAAVDTLVSRPKYLPVLLAALADGTIAPRDVSSFQVRQLWMSADEPLRARLQALWPELRHSPAEKAERIAHFQRLLTPARLASADRARGRGLFDKACASCHRLFGHGGRIGPELTGAQRDNLFYLLHNLVDPSAQVAENYRLSTVTTADGRVLSGVAGETTPETMALQTATERLVIPRSEIAAVEPTELSLMPERMLDALAEDEAADLFAYLMSPQQVEAGPEAP